MRTLGFGHYALTGCATVAILAGCGGSQPSVATPGSTAQDASTATHGQSWMKPGTSSGNDLVYAASDSGIIYVISYPQGQLVGEVDPPYIFHSRGMCSDSKGDIFVPVAQGSEILEHAHGGTQPFATIRDVGGYAWSCAVDPTTGNLAVTNINWDYEQDSNVAIYPDAQGDPTYYSGIAEPLFCGYDNQGNLFVDNGELWELPSGGESLTNIALKKDVADSQVQWDGKHITVASYSASTIYRLQISGATGKVVGETHLSGLNKRLTVQTWIQGNSIVAPIGPGKNENRVAFWDYPRGGKAVTIVNLGHHAFPTAATFSVGSSR